MIKCKIEYIPFGLLSMKKNIGEITIANDCTGDLKNGNYDIAVENEEKQAIVFRIEGFQRDQGIFKLLNEALTEYLKQKKMPV